MIRPPPTSTLFPYTTLFRSCQATQAGPARRHRADSWTWTIMPGSERSEEHTSELQSRGHLVCRLLLEKKKHTHHRQIDSRDTSRQPETVRTTPPTTNLTRSN